MSLSDLRNRLGDETLVAVRAAAGRWPRGLLGFEPLPDAWCALLERADGRCQFVPSGEAPRAADDDALVLVRTRRITVPLRHATSSRDGHDVEAASQIMLQWVPREADLLALGRYLASQPELTLAALAAAAAAGGGRSALAAHIAQHDAATLVDSDTRAAFVERLRSDLSRFLFETGAQLESVATLELSSPSLEQMRRREVDARQRVARIAAQDQVEAAARQSAAERLAGLSELFGKLKSAVGADAARWADGLSMLAPPERGRLLENLWRLAPHARRTDSIVAVSGQTCLWLSPTFREQRRAALPDTFGGLRSVSFDEQRGELLIGAARGAWVVRASDGEVVRGLPGPDSGPLRTGFNSLVRVGGAYFGTHSQIGLVQWTDAPVEARVLFPVLDGAPQAVRSVVAGPGGAVFFSADDAVQRFDPALDEVTVHTSAAETIAALRTHEFTLLASTAQGRLLRQDLRQPEDWWAPLRASHPIEAFAVRELGGVLEIVAPAGSAGVVSIFDEQNLTLRRLDSAAPIVRAWASDDLILGLTHLRDKLLIAPSTVDAPAAELAVARMLGGPVQDAALVTVPA